jgi:predicted nucleotidyltransferase
MNSTNNFEKILTALEIDLMTPEEQAEIMIDLGNLIHRGTMIRIMEEMPETDKEELHTLMEKGSSEEEIVTYIYKHLPNTDSLVQEVLTEITDDILAVTKG